MQIIHNKSDHQIKLMGLEILKTELGASGLIRFLQQFDMGTGDYVQDREQWQNDYNVDSLMKEINLWKQQRENQ